MPNLDSNHIYLFSKPNCVQCNATKRSLTQVLGERFDELVKVIDVSVDEEARDFIVSAGHQQAPVVYFRDDNWQGFRPDKVKEAAELVAA